MFASVILFSVLQINGAIISICASSVLVKRYRFKMIVLEVARLDILTELINRVRAVVLSGKVDINLHWHSLEDEASGSQRMR